MKPGLRKHPVFGRLRRTLLAAHACLGVALAPKRPEKPCRARGVPYSDRSAFPLGVRFDLSVPEERVFPAKVDLIEAHFSDLLAICLQMEGDSEGAGNHGRSTVRARLDHQTG